MTDYTAEIHGEFTEAIGAVQAACEDLKAIDSRMQRRAELDLYNAFLEPSERPDQVALICEAIKAGDEAQIGRILMRAYREAQRDMEPSERFHPAQWEE